MAPKTSVEVYSIKEEKLPVWVDFSGKTEAFKDVAVVARVKGNLEKRFFEPGDQVKKVINYLKSKIVNMKLF